MRKTYLFLMLIGAIAFVSMSTSDERADLRPCISRIIALYRHQARSLDSFLQQYPRYFYDSTAFVREQKYEELAWHFKHTAGLLIYFEPAIYYKQLVGPFQFARGVKPGFFGVLPDAWLFFGPIGNETDSALHGFTKDDSTDQINFIGSAVTRYRQALQAAKLDDHLMTMDAPALFDLLRMEIFRISTIDLANSDFIIDEAALPSLRGSINAWLAATQELAATLPASEPALRNQWDSLSAGINGFIRGYTDYKALDRMILTRNISTRWPYGCRLFSNISVCRALYGTGPCDRIYDPFMKKMPLMPIISLRPPTALIVPKKPRSAVSCSSILYCRIITGGPVRPVTSRSMLLPMVE